jgi:orotidine-5'-phosphate decarboxylase
MPADPECDNAGVTDTFAARFAAVLAARGPLVFGLDPSADLLEAWGLGDSPDGLDRFADIVLEAAAGSVGLVKPQSAFYERHGWRGVRTLQRLIASAREAGLLVILDIKRGDVGSTNDAYAGARRLRLMRSPCIPTSALARWAPSYPAPPSRGAACWS